jgi:Xaa-Pro aminopeptidase
MRKESVEIYSDETNRAVMRHPGRKFPGVLVQGDTLYSLCKSADEACEAARKAHCNEASEVLNAVRNQLWSLVNHYKSVLHEHGFQLPFSETP